MQFQILSHAGLAVTAGGKTLLCDPWIVGSCYWRSWWNYPPVSPELVASLRPDYIYLTHIHWDHFHGPSLRRLGKDVQILLPREHHPRMRIDLDAMGFKNVREMGHGETLDLAPGFRATSYGFLFPDSGLVMEAEGVTLFNANDAKFMGLPLRQILRRHPAIDFVFCSHSSANQRLCFEIIDDPTRAVDDLDIYITRFANFARRTGARYAIPFASNHCYLHKDTWAFNDFAQTPLMVAEYFRRHRIAAPEVKIMVSGDSYSSAEGFRIAEHDFFTRRQERLEEYRQRVLPTLENYYRLEARATIAVAAVEKYFQKFCGTLPFLVRRMFRGHPVTFVLAAGERRYCYRVDLHQARVTEASEISDETDPIQIHTTALIMRHCMASDLFSHMGTSKRVRYRVTRAGKRYLDLLHFLFCCYDYGWLPFRRLVSWRFVTLHAARWREAILAAQMLKDLLLDRQRLRSRWILLNDPAFTVPAEAGAGPAPQR